MFFWLVCYGQTRSQKAVTPSLQKGYLSRAEHFSSSHTWPLPIPRKPLQLLEWRGRGWSGQTECCPRWNCGHSVHPASPTGIPTPRTHKVWVRPPLAADWPANHRLAGQARQKSLSKSFGQDFSFVYEDRSQRFDPKPRQPGELKANL